MSRQTVLTLDDVSKHYAAYPSNLIRFANWFGAGLQPAEVFKAVSNVSFSLRNGEAIALIGQNGAGKSTLLKMITGTVRPSSGRIAVQGRIGAILELGLGFNPEFTGRQNVYQAGGLMGFPREELTRLMPSIEDFAELGDFFDQPLRVYSSGMQARLAFSLATAVRPDVLIIDEVLSVGDSYFQHKSFDRMRRFRDEGAAIVLVTHGLGDVRALCDRVLLLDKGRVVKDGAPDEVVDYYNAMIAEKDNARLQVEQSRGENGWQYTRSGTYEVTMTNLQLLDAQTKQPVATARIGQSLVLRLTAQANTGIPNLVLGCMLRDRTGHVIWGTNTWHTRQAVQNVGPGESVHFNLHFPCHLGPGSYSLTPALTSSDTHLDNNYEWQDNAVVFEVVNPDRPVFIGSSWLDTKFEVKRGDA
ncbi:ABC transporter ATP-binding protein [Nitratireductor aquibiodomus]|uniref:ABC transporter ATP-binding protein n=1 Tax=Nitratireductor aquibiodomus TaxID=204799 RepID=UPI00046A720E|nr:ABC transporter ATP-binding protein [Nitratireductor aquibiodomus]